ncbi:MAG: ATP-dependent helicase [Deltaproteobacteria bacterium]|nr:ATP-dependent helicase [Deltaproteobacteria bacterium]
MLKETRERYKYILADEFQDTNYAQFELVKLIAGEKQNITVVADDDQSIYKFRGAAISNVLGFKDTYLDSEEITLKENYRSLQPILDNAYRLIQHNNPDRLEVKSGIDKKLVSLRKDMIKGARVKHIHFDTLTSEADAVAEMIKKEVSEGGRSYSDIAILIRGNRDAAVYLNALSNLAIPHSFSGNRGLYQRDEVRVMLSFLRAVTDTSDSFSLFHLATSDVYSINADTLIPCNTTAKRNKRSLYSVMKAIATGEGELSDAESLVELGEDSREKIRAFYEDIKKFSDLSLKKGAGEVLYTFLKETGYLVRLTEEESRSAELKLGNIARFFEIVSNIEVTLRVKTLDALSEHIDTMIEAGDDPSVAEPDDEEDSVSVITVHKSKGLEFPVVYMVGLVAGKFPTTKKAQGLTIPDELIKDTLPSGDFHMEEERRLFYVGMTRAMDLLIMTSAADYGMVRTRKVSPFVLEALDMQKAEAKSTSSAKEKIERFAPGKDDELLDKPSEPIPDSVTLNLSFNQIEDYLNCPLKYRYVNVVKLPLLPHHSIMYGSAVHEAIEAYLKAKLDGRKITEDEVLGVFHGRWGSEGFISVEHEKGRRAKGEETLKQFMKDDADSLDGGIKPLAVEKEFTIPFDGFNIRGRWDLLNKTEAGVEVVDFKTADVQDEEKAHKRAKDSLQLKLYWISYEKSFGKAPSECMLYFVDTGLKGVAIYKDKDIEKVYVKLDKVVDGIRKRDYTATPGFNTCGFCAYTTICKYRY